MLKTPSLLLLLAFQMTLLVSPQLSFAAASISSPAKEATGGNVTREAPAVILDGNSTSDNAVTNSEESIAIAEPKAVKAETDIPVVLETQKKEATVSDSKSKLMISLLMILALIAGGYVLVKKIRQQGKTRDLMPQIKILTQHHMGPKKSLAIIRVAGESILIGVTDQNISLIKTLSLLDEDIPEATPQTFAETMPKDIFKTKIPSIKMPSKNADEDFSFVGIKDAVSEKLKDMRDLG